MCAGQGALLLPLPSDMAGRVFASTIDFRDVETLKASECYPQAKIFQHDFLTQSNEVLPPDLLACLQPGSKWLFLLNPPFQSPTKWRGANIERPPSNPIREEMKAAGMGYANGNAVCQFLWRILRTVREYNLQATVGVFSQGSLWTGEGFTAFRNYWQQEFGFAGGFCVSSRVFPDVKGDWPACFTLWRRGGEPNPVDLDVLVKGEIVGKKRFEPPDKPLNKWVVRPQNKVTMPPLKTALTVVTEDKPVSHKLAANALGWASSPGNDLRQHRFCYILSSAASHGAGWSIMRENFAESMVAIGARVLNYPDWLSDADQCSAPDTSHPDYEQFVTDVTVWLVASAANQSASFSTAYKQKSYEIRNAFFWMSPTIMARVPDLPVEIQRQLERAETPYLVRWLRGRTISSDARWLLDYLRDITVRTAAARAQADPKWQLLRWDAGLYQIRHGLMGGKFELAHERRLRLVGNRLRDQVYDLGMLPRPLTVIAEEGGSK
jgi:hypothetical protein